MNIHEYQAKEVLRGFAVPVPLGKAAFTVEEAVAAAKELGGPVWVVKAQIHAGGRGKGGGVKLAKDPDEAKELAKKILGMNLVTVQTGPSGRIVKRVLIPYAAPQIAETLRLVLGWAWTYVIVAELVGAESGIGHMIMDSQRLLDTGQMIFGIVCIGVIGLLSDLLFKWANQRLWPWAF